MNNFQDKDADKAIVSAQKAIGDGLQNIQILQNEINTDNHDLGVINTDIKNVKTQFVKKMGELKDSINFNPFHDVEVAAAMLALTAWEGVKLAGLGIAWLALHTDKDIATDIQNSDKKDMKKRIERS